MNGNSEPKLGGYEYVLFLGIVMFAIALRGGTRACLAQVSQTIVGGRHGCARWACSKIKNPEKI